MALVAPFLLLLLFGIIEFAWVFGQNLSVTHGAREGARLAAVDFGDADGGSYPVQYEASFGGHAYYLRYRHSWLTVTRDPWTEREEEVLVQQSD